MMRGMLRVFLCLAVLLNGLIIPVNQADAATNNPPSVPGAITSPAAGAVVVDNYNISWSPASDAETAPGGLKYEISLSTDNGSTWNVIYLTGPGVTSINYNFGQEHETNQAKIRIRAHDGTNYGNYVVSGTFSIKKRYYYDKYTTTSSYVDGFSISKSTLLREGMSKSTTPDYYSGYTFDRTQNKYTCTGSYGKRDGESGYRCVSGKLYYYLGYYDVSNPPSMIPKWDEYIYEPSKNTTVTEKGSLTQSNILAVDGTYPDDGVHTDGYWYVKKGLTSNSPVLTLSNANADSYFSRTSGGTITLSGTIFDPNGDSVTISATIGGKNKQVTVTGTGSVKSWSLSWNISADNIPDGNYTGTVVQATDGSTSVTRTYFGRLFVDSAPPTGTLKINNGALATNNTSVTLTLSATDGSNGSGVKEMRFSNNNSTWTSWESFATSRQYTLSSGEGTKTVWVQYRDYAGNISTSEIKATIKLDQTAPTVVRVTSDADGLFKEGSNIPIKVVFNEPVVVTGTPQLKLETGQTDRTALYAGGSGSNEILFNYVVQLGDTTDDLDYTDTGALLLAGGAIFDEAGNAANLTLPVPGSPDSLSGQTDITIDTKPPVLTEVTIRSNNEDIRYAKPGDDVILSFTADEPIQTPSVTIGGIPATVTGSGNVYSAAASMTSDPESGPLAFSISYQDAAGNSGTVTATTDGSMIFFDKSVPTVNAPTVTAVSPTQINVTPNAEDNDSGLHVESYLYNRDGDDIGDWTADTFVDTGLQGNKQYTYKYKARDKAGNVSDYSEEARVFTLAANPISAAVVTKAENSVTFDVTDDPLNAVAPELKLELRIGDEVVAVSDWSPEYIGRTLTGLTPGTEYELWAVVRNGDGVENASVKLLDVKTNQAPVLTLTTPDNLIRSENDGFNVVRLEGTVQDLDEGDELKLKYTIEGLTDHTDNSIASVTADGTEQAFSYDLVIDQTIPEGTYTLSVWAEDDKGGKSVVTERSLNVDKKPPEGALELNNGETPLMVPDHPLSVIPYKVTFDDVLSAVRYVRISTTENFTTPGTYIEHELDGSTSTVEANIQMPLDETVGRTKQVYVQLVDEVGNTSEITESILRNLMPTLEAGVLPKLSAVYPTFTFVANDNDGDSMAKVEAEIVGPTERNFAVEPFSTEWQYDPDVYGALADGSYVARFRVVDEYGLASEWKTVTFVMNSGTNSDDFIVIPPQDGQDGSNPPDDMFLKPTLKFNYVTGKTMDNTLVVLNTAGKQVRSLPQGVQGPGVYTVEWDGRDDSGNPVPTGSYRAILRSFDGVNEFEKDVASVKVDMTAPQIAFNMKPHYNSEIPVNVSFRDDVSEMVTGSVKVLDENGVEVATWSAENVLQETFSPPAEGKYRIVATARDDLGNEVEESFEIVYDVTAPEVTVIFPEFVSAPTAMVRITANDPSGIESIQLNGADLTFTDVEGGVRAERTLSLNVGMNEITVNVRDGAGNIKTQNGRITYTSPTPPSSGSQGTTGDGNEPEEKTWEEIVEEIIGLPKDTVVIDLRNPPSEAVIVDSGQNDGTNVKVIADPDTIRNVDLDKALNANELRELLEDAESRIELQIKRFEDAIGLEIIVIGKDGSVNILRIDIPFTARYTIPEGEDVHEWGVFRLDPETRDWVLVPFAVIDERTLEAQVRTGNVYKAMRLADINVRSWAKREIRLLYNMKGIRVDEDFNPKDYMNTNEIVNALSRIATEQQFEGIVEALDGLNLNKPFLTKQELVMLANYVLTTELELTIQNFASKVTVSVLRQFERNTDESNLKKFADEEDIFPVYRPNMAMAVNYNLLRGEPDYRIHPNKIASKEEASALIVRYAHFYWIVKHNR